MTFLPHVKVQTQRASASPPAAVPSPVSAPAHRSAANCLGRRRPCRGRARSVANHAPTGCSCQPPAPYSRSPGPCRARLPACGSAQAAAREDFPRRSRGREPPFGLQAHLWSRAGASPRRASRSGNQPAPAKKKPPAPSLLKHHPQSAPATGWPGPARPRRGRPHPRAHARPTAAPAPAGPGPSRGPPSRRACARCANSARARS